MRDIATVIQHLRAAMQFNGDLTSEMEHNLKSLTERAAWAAPEMEATLWKNLGDLLARAFPDTHARTHIYKAIFTGLGGTVIQAPSVQQLHTVPPQNLPTVMGRTYRPIRRATSPPPQSDGERILNLLEDTCPGILSKVIHRGGYEAVELLVRTLEKEHPGALVRVLEARKIPHGPTGPTTASETQAVQLAQQFLKEESLRTPTSDKKEVVGELGPLPAEEAAAQAVLSTTTEKHRGPGSCFIGHSGKVGLVGPVGPSAPIQLLKITEPGTKRSLGCIVEELRTAMQKNGDLTPAIKDVLNIIDRFKINDNVPSPAAQGCLWVRLSEVVSWFSTTHPHKAQYQAILDSAQ